MSVELSFSADQDALRRARGEAREHAARLGAPQRVCDTVALVVDELVNNAIEHGAAYRRADLPLTVRIAVTPGGIAVEFYDREMPDEAVRELHDALSQAGQGAPALENERGRGLFLLSVYLDMLQVERDAGGGMCLRGLVVEGSG
ncbi:MAG: ATP-binding protein [Planctomycetes bacterium]|nr:ATP-binding protein [Planctomycetota bacterium]